MKKVALLMMLTVLSVRSFSQEYTNIQMVFVKGGNFFMGCDDHEFLSEDSMLITRSRCTAVSIGSYYIGKFEITNAQYKSLMGVYPPAYIGVAYGNKDCDNCPVVKS